MNKKTEDVFASHELLEDTPRYIVFLDGRGEQHLKMAEIKKITPRQIIVSPVKLSFGPHGNNFPCKTILSIERDRYIITDQATALKAIYATQHARIVCEKSIQVARDLYYNIVDDTFNRLPFPDMNMGIDNDSTHMDIKPGELKL